MPSRPKTRPKAPRSKKSPAKSGSRRGRFLPILITAVVVVSTFRALRHGHALPMAGGGASSGDGAGGPVLTLVESIEKLNPLMDLTVAKNGSLYVMDLKGLQVREGGKWGKRLDLPWEPSGWNYCSVGPKYVYLTRPGAPTLYRVDRALQKLESFNLEGARVLTGVVATADGGAFVADVEADGIFRVDAEGKVAQKITGEGEGTLKDPRALCLGDDDDLYVVDSGLNQVLHFSQDGKLKKAWPGPWERPTLERIGVAKGRVYINNHLGGGLWILSTGGKLEGLCRKAEPDFPMPGPAQLAVGADGYLYLGTSGIGKFLLP